MKYKGYTAQIEIDETAGILFGKVLDIKDLITFQGNTVAELEEDPDKPFSGNLPFRTTPQRHHQIFLAAKKANKSINAWMDEVLAKEAAKAISD